jgi:antitoxin YefM
MTIETTYTQARAGLARLFDRVTQDRDTVIVRRRKGEPVAIIAADELQSLTETAHLLRSPRNAERLFSALARARAREGRPEMLEDLRRELEVAEEGG